MTNHPPAVPADNAVTFLRYAVITQVQGLDGGTIVSPSLLHAAGVTVTVDAMAAPMGFTVQLGSPDDYGSFDQDAFEAALKSAVDAQCAVYAGMLGISLAAVQAAIVINREWSYGSALVPGWAGNANETVTYP